MLEFRRVWPLDKCPTGCRNSGLDERPSRCSYFWKHSPCRRAHWVWEEPTLRVCRPRCWFLMPCRRIVWPSACLCEGRDRFRACRLDWTLPADCDSSLRRTCNVTRLVDSQPGCLCRSSSSRLVLDAPHDSPAWPLDSSLSALVWASPFWRKVSLKL